MPYRVELVEHEEEVDVDCDCPFCEHQDGGACGYEGPEEDVNTDWRLCSQNNFFSEPGTPVTLNDFSSWGLHTLEDLIEYFQKHDLLFCQVDPDVDTFVYNSKKIKGETYEFIIQVKIEDFDRFDYWPRVDGGAGYTDKNQTSLQLE